MKLSTLNYTISALKLQGGILVEARSPAGEKLEFFVFPNNRIVSGSHIAALRTRNTNKLAELNRLFRSIFEVNKSVIMQYASDKEMTAIPNILHEA